MCYVVLNTNWEDVLEALETIYKLAATSLDEAAHENEPYLRCA